jgi:TonB-dependent SusC/RagA subfamily outer membrane receptor
MLKSPIAFSMTLSSGTFYCTKTVGQKTWFALHLRPSYTHEYEVHPKQLTVFWDVSASSSKRDINREINFLRQFISYHNIAQLTILPFNYKVLDTAVFYTGNNFNSRWQQFLQNQQYSGSTQLGCIDLTGMGADMFKVFTDGNNTYGKNKPVTGTALVYAVHTSKGANPAALNAIAGSSGGKLINLDKTTISDAIAGNSKAENWLLNITSASGRSITEQSLPVKLNEPLLINGTMNAGNDTLFFHYGNNSRVNKVEKIVINAEKQCKPTAIDRIPMLNNFDRIIRSSSWENILDFGLQEKVVTSNTAYIVLERVEDYIKYNIAPPKELEEECERMNYVKKDTRQQRLKLKEAGEFDILNGVVNFYNEKIRRWDVNERSIVLSRVDFDKEKQQQETGTDAGNAAITRSERADNALMNGNAFGMELGKNSLEEVVVVGYGTVRRRELTGASAYIRSEELRSMSFTTIQQALQGRVAGLYVTPVVSDHAFNQYRINIRGISPVSGNYEPLFVLDGIPVSGDINSYININDIDNITVFKDAQAGALYGSRAANGAIVITSKKGKAYYRNNGNKPYRLEDMEDIEYLQEIKETAYTEKKTVYERLKPQHEDEPGFYFDMAQHFFESGLKDDAMEILMNAAEASNGSYQVVRAMGYVLESWKQFDDAIIVYEQLMDDYPGNLYSWRDLAWACYQDGKYQRAIDVLYAAIKNNTHQMEWWNLSVKAMMLSELNAIIALHKDELNLMAIPAALIKPIPVDMRIVLDCNKGSLGAVSIKEPGGATCSYSKPVTKNGGALSTGQYGYSYYGGPVEYQVKNALNGKYRVSINYYDYNSYPGKIPAFIRMVTFRNFGKTNQTIKVENVIMDNQFGEVEIGGIKWQENIF